MKTITNIITCVALILAIHSCKDDDDFNVTLFATEAPSEVQTTVEVAQDNSGLVAVSPDAVGAGSFRVFFGDPNNTEALIGRNKTVTNVYPEGQYTIRIEAISTNDKVTEITETIVVETTRILNTRSGLIASETAREIQVTPTADNTTNFTVDFGDGTTQDLTPGESANHIYEVGGDYTVAFVASNPETGRSVEFSDAVSFNTDALDLSLSFDDPLTEYDIESFNGTSTEIVTNPNSSGSNETESNVLAITNSGNSFEGITYELPSAIDFSGNKKIVTLDVFYEGDAEIPVALQFTNGVNGERGVEVITNHTGTGWETLTFDFAANATKVFIANDPENFEPIVATGQYGLLVLFIDGPGSTEGTQFIDNIMQIQGGEPVEILPEFLFDFEDGTLNGSFDFGAPIQIVDNPFPQGNSSAKVLEINRGMGQFQGSGFSIPQIDLTTPEKIVTIKLYSDIPATLSVDLKVGLNGARSANVAASHTGSGWETLTFDYSNATKAFEPDDPENFSPLPAEEVGIYTQIVFIVNGDSTASGTFYMDDIIKP